MVFNRMFRVCAFLLCLIVCGLCAFSNWARKKHKIDLGIVPNGVTFKGSYRVWNESALSLTIDRIAGGCTCLMSQHSKSSVPANSFLDLNFSWHVHGKRGQVVEQKQIVFFKEDATPIAVIFRASVVGDPVLKFIPEHLILDDGSLSRAITLRGWKSLLDQLPEYLVFGEADVRVFQVDHSNLPGELVTKDFLVQLPLSRAGASEVNRSMIFRVESSDGSLEYGKLPIDVVFEPQISLDPCKIVVFQKGNQWRRFVLKGPKRDFMVRSVSCPGLLEWNSVAHEGVLELNVFLDGVIVNNRKPDDIFEIGTSCGKLRVEIL